MHQHGLPRRLRYVSIFSYLEVDLLRIISWIISIASFSILLQTKKEAHFLGSHILVCLLLSTRKDPSPTIIVAGVLGTVELKREDTESELGEDGEGSSNTLVDVVAKDRD